MWIWERCSQFFDSTPLLTPHTHPGQVFSNVTSVTLYYFESDGLLRIEDVFQNVFEQRDTSLILFKHFNSIEQGRIMWSLLSMFKHCYQYNWIIVHLVRAALTGPSFMTCTEYQKHLYYYNIIPQDLKLPPSNVTVLRKLEKSFLYLPDSSVRTTL